MILSEPPHRNQFTSPPRAIPVISSHDLPINDSPSAVSAWAVSGANDSDEARMAHLSVLFILVPLQVVQSCGLTLRVVVLRIATDSKLLEKRLDWNALACRRLLFCTVEKGCGVEKVLPGGNATVLVWPAAGLVCRPGEVPGAFSQIVDG